MPGTVFSAGAVVLALIASSVIAPVAAAQAKLALTVANQSYAADVGDADGATASAQDVAGALTKAGFDVSSAQNVNRSMLEAMVSSVAERARAQAGKCTLVFYYAGHAAAVSSGSSEGGRLILKNAKGAAASQLTEDAVALDAVIGALADAGCKGGTYAAIDGARTNLAEGLGGAVMRGLPAPGEHREAAVLFSTMQGATAANDGALGRALASTLATPDQTMSAIFKNTVRAVADASGRRRVPYLVDNVLDPDCVTCGLGAAPAKPSTAPMWSAKSGTGRRRAGDAKRFRDADGDFDSEHFGANKIAVAPGGLVAATGYNDGVVEVWNPANGELGVSFKAAEGALYRMVWANDGSLLATATIKGAIRVWKRDGTPVREISAGGAPASLTFDATGGNLLIQAALKAERVPLANGIASWTSDIARTDFSAPVQEIMGSIPSQSVWVGERLLWATSDGRLGSVAIGDLGPKPLAPVAGCAAQGGGKLRSPCEPTLVAASDDGNHVAIARQAGLVSLLDGSGRGLTDREVRICNNPDLCLPAGLKYLPGLDAFATLTFDTGLRIWNSSTGELMGGASLSGVPADLAVYQSGGKQYVVLALLQGVSVVASLEKSP